MPHDPLAPIQNIDQTLFEQITASRELAFGEGVLSLKHKLLIAIALDTSKCNIIAYGIAIWSAGRRF